MNAVRAAGGDRYVHAKSALASHGDGWHRRRTATLALSGRTSAWRHSAARAPDQSRGGSAVCLGRHVLGSVLLPAAERGANQQSQPGRMITTVRERVVPAEDRTALLVPASRQPRSGSSPQPNTDTCRMVGELLLASSVTAILQETFRAHPSTARHLAAPRDGVRSTRCAGHSTPPSPYGEPRQRRVRIRVISAHGAARGRKRRGTHEHTVRGNRSTVLAGRIDPSHSPRPSPATPTSMSCPLRVARRVA